MEQFVNVRKDSKVLIIMLVIKQLRENLKLQVFSNMK